MNVLFIHEVDWLKKVVFDIHTLAESLSLRGHSVYAIDFENTWRRNGSFDLGTLRTRRFEGVSRAFQGSSVTLIRPGFIRISGLSRISAALTHYREIPEVIKKYKIDVIVLYSAATNGLQAIRAARKMHIPVVFRSIDILNQLVAHTPLRGPTRVLERFVYSRADMVLTLTPSLTGYAVDFGADKKKIKLLPMPVDTGIFYPHPAPGELYTRWGIGPKDQVILYIGTLFDFSGLDLVIRQLQEIIRRAVRARLLIVGDGPQRQKLESIIKEEGVDDRVTITGFQPYETMPDYINLATVCLNPFLITGATRDIFPGKIVQYLACARAVVATPLPGLVAVTPGEEQGITFAVTPGEMSEKLVRILNETDYRQRLEKNGLEYVKKVHTYESIADRLEESLKEAMEGKCTTTT